jgi:hypothetical protein
VSFAITGWGADGSVAITDEHYRVITPTGRSYVLGEMTVDQLEKLLLHYESNVEGENYYRVRRVYHRKIRQNVEIFNKLGS